MVERQLRAGGIADERVLAAMGAVPREEFVPERWRPRSYDDRALPIGHDQTISQPWVVAAICEALELRGDERVLEIGGGSGYSAAVLAKLAHQVLSVELIPDLATRARDTLRRLGFDDVEVRAGDSTGVLHDADGPFDAIAVHAAAPELPPALVDRLAPAGRMVIPIVRGSSDVLTALRRDPGTGELRRREMSHCRFVPLRGSAGFA